jgi:hypothetical protein
MGDFVGGRIRPAGARLESVFRSGHIARGHLRASDRCHHAAEWRGGGPGGCLRRGRQPDGVRTARCSHFSLQGDHMVRHYVYADVHGVDHASKYDRGVRRKLGVATVLEDVKVCACCSSSGSPGVSSGPSRTYSGSACAVEISSTFVNQAADRGRATERFFTSPLAEVAELADAPS